MLLFEPNKYLLLLTVENLENAFYTHTQIIFQLLKMFGVYLHDATGPILTQSIKGRPSSTYCEDAYRALQALHYASLYLNIATRPVHFNSINFYGT